MKPYTLGHAFLALLVLVLSTQSAMALPRFSRGTSIVEGVIAYQDDADQTQFWYVPTTVPLVLGASLEDFKVTYWGVSRPFHVQRTDGLYASVIGATLSGKARLDLSPAQRAAIIAEIKKVYGVVNPKLLPVAFKDPTVTPYLAKGTLGLTDNKSDIVFPTYIGIGTAFPFVVGSGNNRVFAQYVAAQALNRPGIVANADFAVNVVGKVQFVADPWKHECTADLSQVWSKVRSSAGVSAQIGWFNLDSAKYASIVQDLTRSSTIDCKWKEGDLETEKYGRQLFELTKTVFTELNSKIAGGEGLFKFEPNPDAPDVSGGSGGGGFWPWSVSVNAGYSAAHFKQSITWKQNVEYQGNFYWPVPIAMTLAVQCNSATAHLFKDLDSGEACIGETKAEALGARIALEAQAKNRFIKKLFDRWSAGEIGQKEYEALKAAANEISFTEDMRVARAPLALGVSAGENAIRVGLNAAEIEAFEERELRAFRAKGR